MSLPKIVQSELDSNGIQYDILESDSLFSFYQNANQLEIPLEHLARALIIEANGQQRMLVLRAEDLLDFSSLSDMYGNSVTIKHNYQTKLAGCEPDSRVPIQALQNIEVVIDQSILGSVVIYFDAGIKGCFVRIKGEDFRKLHEGSIPGTFSCPARKLNKQEYQTESEDGTLHSFTSKRIQQRVEETLDLPAMPAIAEEIMRIRIDPRAGAIELAKIIIQDPSLSAQVISWASSPYYGYQGTINSIDTAISRVLGFDLVLNLALGISVGKSLNVATEGPLGLHAYWRQSVYTATLAEKLCSFIPGKNRPQRGLVYLSGLLHNFGQLLLGHLFPPQFYLINRYSEMNPHIRVIDIEHYLLDTTHVDIGAWLMESWNMPEELITAVKCHHMEQQDGEYAIYSNLVLIANRLLNRLEIGDSTHSVLPDKIMQMIGLEMADADRALELIVEDEHELNAIAKQMVA